MIPRRVYVMFAVLALASAAGLYWQSTTASQAGDAAAHADIAAAQAKRAARKSNAVARKAKALASEIQRQRKESIRMSCRGQNRRHDRFVAGLDREIARMPDGPQKRRALATRTVTLRIVDPLAPRQDCGALVARSAPPAKLKLHP